jgi:hypothetical protein
LREELSLIPFNDCVDSLGHEKSTRQRTKENGEEMDQIHVQQHDFMQPQLGSGIEDDST